MKAAMRIAGLTVCCSLVLTVVPLTFTSCSSTPYRESTGEYIDDSTITAKVKANLAKDPDVSAMQVNVETYKGVVQLSGFVNTKEAKHRAGQLAREVGGVRRIENNIVVKPVG